MLESITTKEQFSDILNKHRFVVLKFSAPWCGPCRVIAPKIVKLSEQYPNVKFFEVNADEASELISQFNIAALPTIMVFREDKVTATIQGAKMNDIEKAIKDVERD
jgi:thioredoxin 1